MRTERRLLRVAAAAALAIATVTTALTLPSTASAAPASTQQTKAQHVQHAAGVRAQLLSLIATGADDQQIDADLGLVNVTDNSGANTITPMSSNGSVSVPRPGIYYDTQAREYYVTGTFHWNSQNTNGDCSCSGNVGGYDGLGIRLNQDVNNLGTSMSACPGQWHGVTPYPTVKPWGCVVPSNAWDNDDAGVTYKYQDKSVMGYCHGSDTPNCGIYSATTGTIVMTFSGFSGCLHAYTTYIHTWSSAQITSFGVNKSGFSVSISDVSHGWQATSQSGSDGC